MERAALVELPNSLMWRRLRASGAHPDRSRARRLGALVSQMPRASLQRSTQHAIRHGAWNERRLGRERARMQTRSVHNT